jgi:hypothetical protein
MLMAIADHGLQLKKFSIRIESIIIDIRHASTRQALITTINRLHRREIEGLEFFTDAGDPETSICSLFKSSKVDLRSLAMNTHNANADEIATILRGCRNADTLQLTGKANISNVLMQISDSCHMLVELKLEYDGSINGVVMAAFLQSCLELRSVAFHAALDTDAYEMMAMYGENITDLRLHRKNAGILAASIVAGSFDARSHVYDIDFKKQRKHSMDNPCSS